MEIWKSQEVMDFPSLTSIYYGSIKSTYIIYYIWLIIYLYLANSLSLYFLLYIHKLSLFCTIDMFFCNKLIP